MRRFIPVLLACLTLCLAGCSDQSESGNVDPGERDVPVPASGSATPTNLLEPSAGRAGDASDPVMKSGDTLASGGRKLDGGDPMSSGDPIAKARDLSSADDPLSGSHSGERRVGWYWLRGSVENGHVSVSLNGAPCGDFSDFTNRETTRFVVPGMNHISFTSIPTSRMRPMTAHLILYMRAASADVHRTVPAVTYDLAPKPTTDAPTPAPSSESASNPVVSAPALPQVAAPQTSEKTFFAK